jgi:ABC-type arginine transport system permease subunit
MPLNRATLTAAVGALVARVVIGFCFAVGALAANAFFAWMHWRHL